MLNEGQGEPSGWRGWWQRQARDKAAAAARRDAAHTLYLAIVNQARTPVLFDGLGVPDTPEGRFETVALHAAMVVRRLGLEGRPGHLLAQDLFDLMIDDLDQSLRELGVGDMSVGKYVKRLARNFYARIAALDAGLADGQGDALRRLLEANVYFQVEPSQGQLDRFVRYLNAIEADLAAQGGSDLLGGHARFPAVPPVMPTG